MWMGIAYYNIAILMAFSSERLLCAHAMNPLDETTRTGLKFLIASYYGNRSVELVLEDV